MRRSPPDTRTLIVGAFSRLAVSTRRARPPIAQLLKEAGVARSTLYKHFDDRDSLLLEAMGGALAIIAEAATAEHSAHALGALLEHFWEQRRAALDVLEGRFAERLVRSLADKLMQRAPELERNDAIRIADTQIALLRLWLSGETPGAAAVVADRMMASARAQRTAFR